MQFWRLEEPEYDSDYDSSFINGSLEHKFSLPGIICNECGETWGGARILSIKCPESLRNHKNIKDTWPIQVNKFNELTKTVLESIKKNIKLLPGDKFQPSYLDIPSKPSSDFLWCSIGSVVVSERIKRLFESIAKNDIEFVEVIKRKIGKKTARFPAPIPNTGEPEDIIDEVELLKNTNEIQKYYEMVIKSKSKLPLFTKINGTCAKCKKENIDGESRLLLMTDDIWNGQSIFYLATTLYIIVTDETKKKLEKINPTNLKITNVTRI